MTNKNVDSIVVNDVAINNVFAGEDNSIDLRLRNQNAKNYCWDIEVGFANSDVRKFFSTVEEIQTEKKCSLIWKPQRRGVQAFPRVLIQSRFPYRMLRAWKYYSEKSEVIIFPERKGSDRIPKIQGKQSENELQAQAYEQGLFRDFRDFEKSDSPTRIDWKRSLKHQKHLVKNFETSGEKRVLLTWEMTAGIIDFEARVSQLAYWIDMCHQKQELYCLILNDEKPLYANSLNHYRESLQRLALLEGV